MEVFMRVRKPRHAEGTQRKILCKAQWAPGSPKTQAFWGLAFLKSLKKAPCSCNNLGLVSLKKESKGGCPPTVV